MTFVAEDSFQRISHKWNQSLSILFMLLVGIMFCLSEPATASENTPPAGGTATSGDAGSTAADTAAALFSQRCGGCHTLGKGALVGPDLKGVNSWKATELEATVQRMEKFAGPLKAEEVKALVEFLKDSQSSNRLTAENERAVAVTAQSAPSSADVGQRLFLGTQQFTNGGISCISCHQVEGHGGTMGKDLTTAYEKLGEAALISTCEQPAYPVMKAIYKEHKITRQEALHLSKYLASLNDKKRTQPDLPFVFIGLGGAALMLAGIMLFYRKRNRAVRNRLQRK